MGGQRDDREALAAALFLDGANPPGGLVAVYFRHLAIHEHQDEAAGQGGRYRLPAVGHALHLEAHLFHHRGDDQLVDAVVLRHEDQAGVADRFAGLFRSVGRRRMASRLQRRTQFLLEHRLRQRLHAAVLDVVPHPFFAEGIDKDYPGRVGLVPGEQAFRPGHVRHAGDDDRVGLAGGRGLGGLHGLHKAAILRGVSCQHLAPGGVGLDDQHPEVLEPWRIGSLRGLRLCQAQADPER